MAQYSSARRAPQMPYSQWLKWGLLSARTQGIIPRFIGKMITFKTVISSSPWLNGNTSNQELGLRLLQAASVHLIWSKPAYVTIQISFQLGRNNNIKKTVRTYPNVVLEVKRIRVSDLLPFAIDITNKTCKHNCENWIELTTFPTS